MFAKSSWSDGCGLALEMLASGAEIPTVLREKDDLKRPANHCGFAAWRRRNEGNRSLTSQRAGERRV